MADMNNAPRGRHFKRPAGQGTPSAQMPQQPPANGRDGRTQLGGTPYGSSMPGGTPSCRLQPQRPGSGAPRYVESRQSACGQPAGGSSVPPKRRGKTPFIVAGIIVALVGVLVGIGAAALFSAKELKVQASEVLTCVDSLSESVKAQDFGAAAGDAQQIANLSGDMMDKLSSPLWTAVSFVPVVGHDITSARTVVGSLNGVASDVLVPVIDAIAANPMSELISSDKAIDIDAVGQLFGALGDVAEPMQKCTEAIEAVPPFHISMLEEKMGPVREKLVKANDLVQKAADLAPLATAILGADGDRAYLVAAQNSAEIRASGGFPGSMGVLRIQAGQIVLDDFSKVYDVLSDDTAPSLGITDEEKSLFGYYMDVPRDAGMDPDFTRVAEIWAVAYEEKTGTHVDGVLSVTPSVVQSLLGIAGPITLGDGTMLDGSNAAKVLQHDLYWNYLSKGRLSSENAEYSDTLFAQAADLAFDQFFSGLDSAKLVKFLDLMSRCMENRSVMFWLADSSEQELLAPMDCSGDIVSDPLKPVVGTYLSLWLPCKMGWYIDLENSIKERRSNADGTSTYCVETIIRNTATQDVYEQAGEYITGGRLEGYEWGNLYPDILVYAPVGGTISNISASNGIVFTETEHKGMTLYKAGSADLRAGDTIVVSYEVTTCEGADELTFKATPTLTAYR